MLGYGRMQYSRLGIIFRLVLFVEYSSMVSTDKMLLSKFNNGASWWFVSVCNYVSEATPEEADKL